jgi:arylsulfatase A-like enzyme
VRGNRSAVAPPAPSRAGLAALWFAVALAGCGAPARPNVLLVVVDTLRADHVGAYGYARETTPALDRLAAEGARFDTALVSSPWSAPSHATILTGLAPLEHGVMNWGNPLRPSATTLAERLAAHGYRTGFFSAHKPLGTSVDGIARGFQTVFQRGRKDDARVLREAREWTRAGAAPWYAHVILMGVHAPYDRYPPDYDERFFTDLPPGGERVAGAAAHSDCGARGIPPSFEVGALRRVGDYVNRYDRALRHVDDQLAALFAALAADGALDDTLVIVTSDHGESLGERDFFGHGCHFWEELVRVPLLVRLPGRIAAGARVAEPVQLLDLAPSVLGAVGLPAPGELPGVDLLARLRGPALPPRLAVAAFHDTRHWSFMVRSARHKLVFDEDERRPELYDLVADPREQTDLLAGPPDAVPREAYAELHARLLALSEAYRGFQAERSAPLSPEAHEALRALGYVADPAPPGAD